MTSRARDELISASTLYTLEKQPYFSCLCMYARIIICVHVHKQELIITTTTWTIRSYTSTRTTKCKLGSASHLSISSSDWLIAHWWEANTRSAPEAYKPARTKKRREKQLQKYGFITLSLKASFYEIRIYCLTERERESTEVQTRVNSRSTNS